MKLFLTLSIFLSLIIVSTITVDAAWLSGWNYRKSHIINSASGAGTNYQIKITAYYGNGTDVGGNVYLSNHSRTDFGDVRFTDDDGTTLLDYWMESKVDSNNAVFWVEVAKDLSTTNQTIYIYYGKSDTTTSNGGNTFLFFDDFSTDLSKWTVMIGTWTITGDGKLRGSGSARVGLYMTGSSLFDAAIDYVATTPVSDVNSHGPGCYFRGDGTLASGGVFIRGHWHMSSNYWQFKTDTTSLVSNTANNPEGTTKVNSVRFYGTSLKMFADDVQVLSTISTAGTSPGKVGIESYNPQAGVYWDDYRVRKYVEPEPTHGSWGNEETIYYISGYVFGSNGTGLSGVTVSDNQSFGSNISISDGYYKLPQNYTNGVYNLSFSKTEFDTGYLVVTVNSANLTNQNKTIYDNTSPTQVTGLANDTPTATIVNLNWNAASDSGGGVWGYQVFKNDSHLGYTQNLYYNVTGLSPNTLYQFKVRANDTYNNWGANSSILNVTTAETPSQLYERTGTQTISISEEIGKSLIANRETIQSFNLSDVIIRQQIMSRAVIQFITISDALGRSIIGIRDVTQPFNLAEAIVRNLLIFPPTPSPTQTPPLVGGRAGPVTGEPLENVAVKEVVYILGIGRNESTTKQFAVNHSIIEIGFTYLAIVDEVSITIEKLIDRSLLVNIPPPGIVYEYINIWISENNPAPLTNATIKIRVDEAWIAANNIDPASIAMYRYIEGMWSKLEIVKLAEDEKFITLLVSTPGFSSPFAITGEKIKATLTPVITPTTPAPLPGVEEREIMLPYLSILIIAIIGFVVIVIIMRIWRRK